MPPAYAHTSGHKVKVIESGSSSSAQYADMPLGRAAKGSAVCSGDRGEGGRGGGGGGSGGMGAKGISGEGTEHDRLVQYWFGNTAKKGEVEGGGGAGGDGGERAQAVASGNLHCKTKCKTSRRFFFNI